VTDVEAAGDVLSPPYLFRIVVEKFLITLFDPVAITTSNLFGHGTCAGRQF
jgi:hypothetical protein